MQSKKTEDTSVIYVEAIRNEVTTHVPDTEHSKLVVEADLSSVDINPEAGSHWRPKALEPTFLACLRENYASSDAIGRRVFDVLRHVFNRLVDALILGDGDRTTRLHKGCVPICEQAAPDGIVERHCYGFICLIFFLEQGNQRLVTRRSRVSHRLPGARSKSSECVVFKTDVVIVFTLAPSIIWQDLSLGRKRAY